MNPFDVFLTPWLILVSLVLSLSIFFLLMYYLAKRESRSHIKQRVYLWDDVGVYIQRMWKLARADKKWCNKCPLRRIKHGKAYCLADGDCIKENYPVTSEPAVAHRKL
jgi:hypothetical protein